MPGAVVADLDVSAHEDDADDDPSWRYSECLDRGDLKALRAYSAGPLRFHCRRTWGSILTILGLLLQWPR